MPKIKHVELFMSSRSPSVILTLASLNLVCFIFSLFLFNFYWFFLVAIIKMLKIKDKFAKILKLFSSVEKVETPPICMTVYYKIKSIVTWSFFISLCRLNFQSQNALTSVNFSVGFVLLLGFMRCPLQFPTRFFEKQNLREKNKFLL